MRIKVVVILFPLLLLASSDVFGGTKDDILSQKKEMEKIQKEVEASRQKLDSLKQAELSINKKMSDSDQKLATNKKVIGRLNKELEELKAKVSDSESELEKIQLELELARRRYLGNIRQFYLAAHKPQTVFSEDPNEEMTLRRQTTYLTALASFESGNVGQVSEYLAQTTEKMSQLAGEKKKVSRLKRDKETASSLVSSTRKRQEKELELVRRKKTEETDRILTLEQAAREMEKIIARLQQEVEDRKAQEREVDLGPSVFASLRGQLVSPCRGKVTVPFGNLVDPVTKLKSFSPGISIQGSPGRSVVSVAAGTVAYVGNLRGYGNFVIVNHDDRYYTTYAGLGQAAVSTGEYVLANTKLAVSGEDGTIKFELREGSKPLDPVPWIRIDSF